MCRISGTIAWNGELLTSGSRDKTIQQRDARVRNGIVTTWDAHGAEVCGLKWSDDDIHLASGGNDNKLIIWDKRTGGPVWTPDTPHQAAVKALAWSPHKVTRSSSGFAKSLAAYSTH